MTVSGCPPQIALERFRLKEFDRSTSESWRAHIEGCARCARALEALEAEEARFLSSQGFGALEAKLESMQAGAPPKAQAPRWKFVRWLWAAPLAAAILLLVIFPRPRDGFLGKGAGVLALYVQPAEQASPTGPTQAWHGPLPLGARAQMVWTGAQAGHIAIFGLQPSGEVTQLYPESGDRSAPVTAGANQSLGRSLLIDAGLDDAQLIVVFSETAFSLDDPKRSLQRDGALRGAQHLRLQVQR